MRITSITLQNGQAGKQANASSINFGYNKSLNKTLRKTLSSEKTEFNNLMLELNKFCNTTEESLLLRTKRQEPDESGFFDKKTETLIDVFMEAKGSLASAIKEHFPILDFAKKEARHYETASKGDWDTWQGEASEMLLDIADDFAIKANSSAEEMGEEFSSGFTKTAQKVAKDKISEYLPTSESPKGFASLGGMQKLKDSFNDKIIFPIQNPEMAKLDELEYGKKFPRASLLIGPPGCGKTFIAEAVAREADVPFYVLKLGKQGSIYVNGTSLNYESAFEAVAKRAEETKKPCVLFLDELEGLTPDRGGKGVDDSKAEQVGTLLDLINSARSRGIVLIGAGNKYKSIDEAIRNRFDFQEYVGLPDKPTRIEVIKKALEGRTKATDLLSSEENLAEIAEKLDKFPNRSIVDLTNSASLTARSDGRRQLTKEDFFETITKNQNLRILNESEYQFSQAQNRPTVGFKLNQ